MLAYAQKPAVLEMKIRKPAFLPPATSPCAAGRSFPVPDQRMGRVGQGKTPPRPKHPVDLLEIQKEALVQQAHTLQKGTGNQHARAQRKIQGPGCRSAGFFRTVLPAITVQKRAAQKRIIAAAAISLHHGGRRDCFAVEHRPAGHAAGKTGRGRVQSMSQKIEGRRMHYRVVIQQPDPIDARA